MNRVLARGSLALLALTLVGCGRHTPSEAAIRAELELTLPQHIRFESIKMRFSPLLEVMGTTLPEGTYQVQVSATAELTEPLYRLVSHRSADEEDFVPNELRMALRSFEQLTADLPNTGRITVADVGPAPVYPPVLVEVEKSGKRTDVGFLMAATPTAKGWQVDLLEGDPAGIFTNGQPRSAFSSAILTYGSVQQRERFKSAFAEVQSYRTEILRLLALQQEVDRLNDAREALKKQRFRDAYAKVSSLQQRRTEAIASHNEEMSRIIGLGTMANDFRERDIPTRDAEARLKRELDRLDIQIGQAQNAASESDEDVDEEVDSQISALISTR